MIREVLHAFSVFDHPVKDIRKENIEMARAQQRPAYYDPEHDIKHLERVYDTILKEGCHYLKRSQDLAEMARERFAEADRVNEQLAAAEAVKRQLRA